jgi:hypothetical protein
VRLPLHLWLEPCRPDIDLGMRARVADPVWFLARQWQLGEHQGEDASSPVAVAVDASHTPLTYDPARPDLDPTVVPAEALLEAGPDDWWTIGRRIGLGRRVTPMIAGEPTAVVDTWRFAALPAPYEAFTGAIDGAAVFAAGALAGDPVWSAVPHDLADRWSSSELNYGAQFTANGTVLAARDHDGGDADWFTVDADSPVVAPVPSGSSREVIPGRLDYPGAPNPRWWQLEDHAVDIGGFSPDRSHLGAMLLFDVALAHSDDWFAFPVPPPVGSGVADPPSSGVVVTLRQVTVRDSFDEVWPLSPPPSAGPGAWSLFHTAGLPESALVIWPIAAAPLSGPLLDDIALGVDEDANLAWAVEMRANGLALLPDQASDVAVLETTRTGTRNFRYLPSTTLPFHWHAYERVRADDPAPQPGGGDGRSGPWRQAIVADLTGPDPVPRPGPISRLIGGPSGTGVGRGHLIAAHALASSGIRLQRRPILTRDTSGRPVLWVERSVRPLLGPPTAHLRFDVFAEDAPA